MNKSKSVAESLNAIVKPHLVTMSEQYNVYAKAILEMEDKIRALKQIMLSQDFLNNVRDVNLVTGTGSGSGSGSNLTKSNKVNSKKENKIVSDISVENATPTETKIESQNHIPKLSFYTPRQKDSLFWCFNIIANGLSGYEYEKNYFTAEQEFKVKIIERIKNGENKQILKQHKMSKNMIESGLMGSKTSGISPKILYALSLFYNVNIFYVYKNTYYEMITNTEKPIHIIIYNAETNNFSIRLPVDMHAKETLIEHNVYMEKIKESFWKLDNLEKPLRPITVYSVNDLINICSKLEIPIICESSNKNKKKAELYSAILQKI